MTEPGDRHAPVSVIAMGEIPQQVQKLYKRALNKASRGVYQAHQLYLKLSAAYHQLAAILRALRKVSNDQQAKAIARALNLVAQRTGLAFLILLFLVIYVDTVMANADKKKARDKWVKEQRDVLQFMIKETGEDIATYAESLHAQPSSADLVRERNDRITRRLASAIADDRRRPPVVAEVLKGMLAELGIKDWEALLEKGVFQVLAEGVEQWLRDRPEPVAGAAHSLGDATGTFVGTLFLERALLSAKWRERLAKKSPAIGGAVNKTLAAGSARALWTMVRQSLDGLRETAKRAVGSPAAAKAGSASPFEFEHATRSDAVYRETFKALRRYDRDLDKSMSELAGRDDLAARIRSIVARAQTEAPPAADAWNTDAAGWPPDAMSFILDCWMRIALDLALSAFAEMDDATPFGGDFRLATLLEVLGLDVALDDPAVKAARVEFDRRGSDLMERFERPAGAARGGADEP
jgi:hypothetical protein